MNGSKVLKPYLEKYLDSPMPRSGWKGYKLVQSTDDLEEEAEETDINL